MPFIKTLSIEDRLLSTREITPEGCWNWTGYAKKPSPKKKYLPYGYTSIGSRTDQTIRRVQVHRLAASLWLGFDLDNSSTHVLHRCDNPRCFNPEHLFFGDNLSNVADRHAKGRSSSPRGEGINTAKLTAEKVTEIRHLAETQKHSDIAIRFGVARSTITRIVSRKFWSHVA